MATVGPFLLVIRGRELTVYDVLLQVQLTQQLGDTLGDARFTLGSMGQNCFALTTSIYLKVFRLAPGADGKLALQPLLDVRLLFLEFSVNIDDLSQGGLPRDGLASDSQEL